MPRPRHKHSFPPRQPQPVRLVCENSRCFVPQRHQPPRYSNQTLLGNGRVRAKGYQSIYYQQHELFLMLAELEFNTKQNLMENTVAESCRKYCVFHHYWLRYYQEATILLTEALGWRTEKPEIPAGAGLNFFGSYCGEWQWLENAKRDGIPDTK